MNRRYTADEFIERCRRIQAMLDRPALTTDVIVGFPGETDADFEATCRVAEAVGFAKVHAFRFSPRQGTPAADMPDQVPGRIASHRARTLEALGDRLRNRYFQRLLGRPLQVMIEGEMPDRPGWIGGTSNRHAFVALPGGRASIGQLVDAVPRRIENDWLWALQKGISPIIE
jgi:threonylcarbamoyladenosine tRNA methylthiotransferase MtaB